MLTGIFSGNSFVTAVALAKVWTLPNAIFVVVLSNRLGTTKIFVGNIRDGTTSESLRELFECYGRVTEADVLSGFGFVVSASALLHLLRYVTHIGYCLTLYHRENCICKRNIVFNLGEMSCFNQHNAVE